MKYIKVESLEHLKQLSLNRGDDFVDFVLLIGGGIARSSKRITYYEDMDKFYIINEIDESFQKVLSKDLDSKTNIMAGINSGSFFAEVA